MFKTLIITVGLFLMSDATKIAQKFVEAVSLCDCTCQLDIMTNNYNTCASQLQTCQAADEASIITPNGGLNCGKLTKSGDGVVPSNTACNGATGYADIFGQVYPLNAPVTQFVSTCNINYNSKCVPQSDTCAGGRNVKMGRSGTIMCCPLSSGPFDYIDTSCLNNNGDRCPSGVDAYGNCIANGGRRAVQNNTRREVQPFGAFSGGSQVGFTAGYSFKARYATLVTGNNNWYYNACGAESTVSSAFSTYSAEITNVFGLTVAPVTGITASGIIFEPLVGIVAN